MFKFSKFAVAAAALMTQTHAAGAPAAGATTNTNTTAAAAPAKPSDKKAHPMDNVLAILTNIPEDKRVQFRARMRALAAEWASIAALKIEKYDVQKYELATAAPAAGGQSAANPAAALITATAGAAANSTIAGASSPSVQDAMGRLMPVRPYSVNTQQGTSAKEVGADGSSSAKEVGADGSSSAKEVGDDGSSSAEEVGADQGGADAMKVGAATDATRGQGAMPTSPDSVNTHQAAPADVAGIVGADSATTKSTESDRLSLAGSDEVSSTPAHVEHGAIIEQQTHELSTDQPTVDTEVQGVVRDLVDRVVSLALQRDESDGGAAVAEPAAAEVGRQGRGPLLDEPSMDILGSLRSSSGKKLLPKLIPGEYLKQVQDTIDKREADRRAAEASPRRRLTGGATPAPSLKDDQARLDDVLDLFNKIENLKGQADLSDGAIFDDRDRKDLIGTIIAAHGKTEDQKKAEVDSFTQAITSAYPDVKSDEFKKQWDEIDSRMVKALKMLADSTRECLSGDCDDEALKAVAAGKQTLDEAIGKIEVPDSIKEADKIALDKKDKTTKIVEDFAKKVNAGTKTTKLQVQLKKKEAESKALALGLGLGLGLGLPAVFAVSMLVLFKSGRLAWVPSTSIDSQA